MNDHPAGIHEDREMVRQACLHAAREACRDAMTRGLCAQGALEAALGAIETLNIDEIERNAEQDKQ